MAFLPTQKRRLRRIRSNAGEKPEGAATVVRITAEHRSESHRYRRRPAVCDDDRNGDRTASQEQQSCDTLSRIAALPPINDQRGGITNSRSCLRPVVIRSMPKVKSVAGQGFTPKTGMAWGSRIN